MSGVTLAVSGEPDKTASSATTTTNKPQQKHVPGAAGVRSMNLIGSLRVIELQLVAFVLVFSASGLVPLLDLVFPALVSLYILLLSRFAFPSYGSGGPQSPIFHGSMFFQAYVVVGTIVGLFLPLAYVLGGFGRGDEHAVRSASPHLFLLSVQILTENVISGLSLFSPPVRALVPLMYTVKRIFVDIDWIHNVWLNKSLPANPNFKDTAWFWFGRGLSVANLVYFSINLLGFLVPRFLPRAFERYFQQKGEIYAKEAEDKAPVIINKPHTLDKKTD